MMRNVAVVVLDGVSPFELGVLCEVFGSDRSKDGLPRYDFAVVAGQPGPLRAESGFTLHTPYALDRLAEADLIAVPAISGDITRGRLDELPRPLLAALRAGADRGARMLSVCTGAFVLGAAGLLDDRRCTTHWMHAEQLARLCPAAKVDPSVLYVDDDPIFTSAGTAAGIDACLYLLRKEHGSRVAMSARTFARRFVQETGTTPQRWLTGQRILLAQQLLEESDMTVDLVAELSGFGNATALRHHFRAWRATTPQAYRRQFRDPAPPPPPGPPAQLSTAPAAAG